MKPAEFPQRINFWPHNDEIYNRVQIAMSKLKSYFFIEMLDFISSTLNRTSGIHFIDLFRIPLQGWLAEN